MSKADAKPETAAAVTGSGMVRDRLLEVRLQAGSVHWQGARPISHITTDRARLPGAGTHLLVADELHLHPAGALVRVDGSSWIIPHARVETYRLA